MIGKPMGIQRDDVRMVGDRAHCPTFLGEGVTVEVALLSWFKDLHRDSTIQVGLARFKNLAKPTAPDRLERFVPSNRYRAFNHD